MKVPAFAKASAGRPDTFIAPSLHSKGNTMQQERFKPAVLQLLHSLVAKEIVTGDILEQLFVECDIDNATIIEIRGAVFDGRGRPRKSVRLPERSMHIGMPNGGQLD